MKKSLYARHVSLRVAEALEDSPVVLIQGPRQCGKTTLAQMVGDSGGYAYRSFDDDNTRKFAEVDPIDFVEGLPERTILDEVQKVPGLFSTLKLAVDRERTAGRFILTGSVNVLQVRQITDSLAGRMQIIDLHPLSQSELLQTPSKFLDTLFSIGSKRWQDASVKANIEDRVVVGGYPVAAQLSDQRRRAAWYKNYIKSLVQHDAPDISNIRSPEILSGLLTVVASETAQLMNVNRLSSSFQTSRQTIQGYLSLLQKMFMVRELPAWHSSHMKRLVKTPKIHFGDTGIACALLNLNKQALIDDRAFFGHMLETFVFQELCRQASGHEESHRFSHYRERDGAEVDIVIERGATDLVGVEVKAAATLKDSDFYGLHRLKAASGKRFVGGVLLYSGDKRGKFGDNLYAIPLQSLWQTT